MKPVSSNIKPNNKCLNPVTTKCVTWDGPEITCLDGTVLCKGQSVETTLYTIATKLCQVIDELKIEGLNTCIEQIEGGPNVSLGTSPTLQQVFSAIIAKVCAINDRIVELEGEDCPILTVEIPTTSCLRGTINPAYNVTLLPNWDSATNSIPVVDFAEFVATVVCSMLIDITQLQSNVDNINQAIADLWFALDNCANNCDTLVLPTCTYDFSLNQGEPVTVQTAYSWLEADYCELKSYLGSAQEFEEAINKQCPDLDNQERLSGGGTMSNISGWISNPVTLADSLGNAWLTICDMRSAVSEILSGCCFDLCRYLKVGYDLKWDPDGNYVNITFNDSSNPVIYTDPSSAPAPTSPQTAVAGGSLLAWASTAFPTGSQSNVLLVLNDGTVTVTIDTGQPINYWAFVSNGDDNGFNIDFNDPIFSGYDKTSTSQTLNIYFTYDVVSTTTKSCTFDQVDGFVYECCAPAPYGCDVTVTTTGDSGTGIDVVLTGVSFPDSVPAGVIPYGSTSAVGANTITVPATNGLSAAGVGAMNDYIVTVTGGGSTQCRYITGVVNAGATDVVTVNSNWDTSPASLPAVSTFTIENKYVDITTFPVTSGDPALDACVNSLVDFSAKVVEINSTYNPADPSTWTIATQSMNISIIDITNQGYQVPEFYLENNKSYAVVLYANYPCGQSDYTIVDYGSPILATVTIQQGTQSNPASGVFASTWSISVYDILSNGVAKPSTAAGPSGPASFALSLPVGTNLTEFKFTPVQALWNTTQASPVVPKSFCYCGINIDPLGANFNVGGVALSPRDYVLGLYRGYSVDLLYRNPLTQAVSPLLDSLGAPYHTDTLADYTLTFSGNNPTNPYGTTSTGFTPNVAPITASYQYNSYPLIVRYDPNNYKVDTSPQFHKVTLDSLKIRMKNDAIAFPYDIIPANYFTLVWHVDVKKWDPVTQSYQNTGGSYAQQYTFTLPSVNLALGAFDSIFSATPNLVADADYGSLVMQYITIAPTGTPTTLGVQHSLGTLGFEPDPASQFSCNNPATVINNPCQTSLVSWTTQPWISSQSRVFWRQNLLTEDYLLRVGGPNSSCGGVLNVSDFMNLEIKLII
jgi:hypothetical protein